MDTTTPTPVQKYVTRRSMGMCQVMNYTCTKCQQRHFQEEAAEACFDSHQNGNEQKVTAQSH